MFTALALRIAFEHKITFSQNSSALKYFVKCSLVNLQSYALAIHIEALKFTSLEFRIMSSGMNYVIG